MSTSKDIGIAVAVPVDVKEMSAAVAAEVVVDAEGTATIADAVAVDAEEVVLLVTPSRTVIAPTL